MAAKINLEFINNTLDDVLDDIVIDDILIAAKALVILFILGQFTRRFMKSRIDDKEKISKNDIGVTVSLVLALIFYDVIINQLENLGEAMDKMFMKMVDNKEHSSLRWFLSKDFYDEEASFFKKAWGAAKSAAKTAAGMINPSHILMHALKFLMILLDIISYSLVLIIRYFNLFLVKIFGPFAIAASAYERFRSYFWNWLKMFAINYLWLGLILIINLMCATLLNEIIEAKTESWVSFFMRFKIETFALTILVIAKISLYIGSKKFLNKLFS